VFADLFEKHPHCECCSDVSEHTPDKGLSSIYEHSNKYSGGASSCEEADIIITVEDVMGIDFRRLDLRYENFGTITHFPHGPMHLIIGDTYGYSSFCNALGRDIIRMRLAIESLQQVDDSARVWEEPRTTFGHKSLLDLDVTHMDSAGGLTGNAAFEVLRSYFTSIGTEGMK
jgi:hypothetical protein